MDSLSARLVPPSGQYPDSMCELVLTERHLYVLEGGYDGRYEAYFTFYVERIGDLRTEIKALRHNWSALGELFISLILALFGGTIYTSGETIEDDGVRFLITYNDGMGQCTKLYFKDLQSNANHFIKTFHELKK